MIVFMSICIFLFSLNSINIFYLVGKTNIGDMDILVMPNSLFGVIPENETSTKHRALIDHSKEESEKQKKAEEQISKA